MQPPHRLKSAHLRLSCDTDGVEASADDLGHHDLMQHLDGAGSTANLWCVLSMTQLSILIGAPGQDVAASNADSVFQTACHSPAGRKSTI